MSGPDGTRRLIVVRVRLGSGLMGRLAISSSVSRWSVPSVPPSSLPRRFLRTTCASDFGTGSALLVFSFGWLVVELFDWLLGRDLSVGVGAVLLSSRRRTCYIIALRGRRRSRRGWASRGFRRFWRICRSLASDVCRGRFHDTCRQF
jgi:hypothetical protein